MRKMRKILTIGHCWMRQMYTSKYTFNVVPRYRKEGGFERELYSALGTV